MVGPDGNAPSSLAYQASALLLSYEPVMAESGGLAPQSAYGRSICFRNSARASAGSLSKWRRAVVLPHRPCGPNRLPTGHRASRLYSPNDGGGERSCSPSRKAGPVRFKRSPAPRPVSPPLVPAAGFAPASIRLEDGCLSCSATRRWTSRRDSHPQPGVRSTA